MIGDAVQNAYLDLERVAALCSVAPSVVGKWLEDGELSAEPTESGFRVEARTLRAFLIDHALPVPGCLLGVRSVLLIDDEPNILRSTARMLKIVAPELAIELAESAPAGLSKLAAETFDAVVVDTYMPEMSGLEACSAIKSSEETAHIAVIAVTGDSSPELRAAFGRAGASALLEKPIEARVLFDALSADLVL